MKVFTCIDHEGYWPVGAASVVVAESLVAAIKLLQDALDKKGLGKKPFTLQELNLDEQSAVILVDGEY